MLGIVVERLPVQLFRFADIRIVRAGPRLELKLLAPTFASSCHCKEDVCQTRRNFVREALEPQQLREALDYQLSRLGFNLIAGFISDDDHGGARGYGVPSVNLGCSILTIRSF
jgi:hypothetical protein